MSVFGRMRERACAIVVFPEEVGPERARRMGGWDEDGDGEGIEVGVDRGCWKLLGVRGRSLYGGLGDARLMRIRG